MDTPDLPPGTPPVPGFYVGQGWNPERSVGLLIKRVGQSIVLHADRRLAELGLTHAQWVLLFKLGEGHCATVAALARDLQTDAGAMTRALDRLEAKALVRRARSGDDRRVVQVELTEAGQRVAAQVHPVLAQVLNEHLAGFDHAEWQQLLGLLQRMARNGDAMREACDHPVMHPAASSSFTPDLSS
jgi:DNA-binding MarR family transcriptional regulator